MGLKWNRGPTAAVLIDDLLRALAYAEARATDLGTALPADGPRPNGGDPAQQQARAHRARSQAPGAGEA